MRFFLTTTWSNEQVLAGSPSITYNNASTTYSSVSTNYNGQAIPIWSNETRTQ